VVTAATVAALAVALPASAHVTVTPDSATQGGDAVLTFQVPGEEANAATTQVQLFLPTASPIPVVDLKPMPGWTESVHRTTLTTPVQSDDGPVTDVVSDITWTAADTGSAIQNGQFQQFEISVGPLPSVGELDFKVLQTYSDGTVVRWIDLQQPGAAEPDHPAPVLRLSAASDAAAQTSPASPTNPAGQTIPTTQTAQSKSNDARGLAVSALIVAALGLLAGVGALLRRPRPRSAPTAEPVPAGPPTASTVSTAPTASTASRVDVEP